MITASKKRQGLRKSTSCYQDWWHTDSLSHSFTEPLERRWVVAPSRHHNHRSCPSQHLQWARRRHLAARRIHVHVCRGRPRGRFQSGLSSGRSPTRVLTARESASYAGTDSFHFTSFHFTFLYRFCYVIFCFAMAFDRCLIKDYLITYLLNVSCSSSSLPKLEDRNTWAKSVRIQDNILSFVCV